MTGSSICSSIRPTRLSLPAVRPAPPIPKSRWFPRLRPQDCRQNWPTDGRAGGVPDPLAIGPPWIQIGTEGGFLPTPVVIPSRPIAWNSDPTTFNFGNVSDHSLLLAPAERADVVIDFSAYAGQTLILYNDAPAAFPALDPRYDYYTGNPDLTDTGGHSGTAGRQRPQYPHHHADQGRRHPCSRLQPCCVAGCVQNDRCHPGRVRKISESDHRGANCLRSGLRNVVPIVLAELGAFEYPETPH